MRTLLIIEPHWEGHHLKYACWMIREAAERGYKVWFAGSPSCLHHPLLYDLKVEYTGRLQTVSLTVNEAKPVVQGTPDLVRRELRYQRMFAECYQRLSRSERLDYVFLPYLDYCMYAIALIGSPFGNTPWGGLIMQPTFYLRGRGFGVPDTIMQRLKERLFLRLLGNEPLRAIFTLDEALVEHVRRVRPDRSDRLRFLPEPAEIQGTHSRQSARQALGIPERVTIIMVYGELDSTKGIDALLAAAKEERFPDEVGVLLAGRQDAEVKALLSSERAEELRREGRLYDLDKFVSGEDEHAVFQAADVVWLGYREQYVSSGVLLQAAMAGLPVVACDEGMIGWLTNRHSLGLTVAVENSQEVAEAVATLESDQELSRKLGENGRRFSAAHSVSSFREAIGRELLDSFPLESGAHDR